MKRTLSAATLIAVGLVAGTASAATVWNVNVGNGSAITTNANGITTSDNYIGAASENTTNSTWNAVTNTDLTILADSTGSNLAGVTFQLASTNGSAIGFGGQGLVGGGDEIFNTWIKDGDGDGSGSDVVNDDPFTVTFGNLDTGATYALVVYADWYWEASAVPVTLTKGSGLSGTFTINSPRYNGTDQTSVGAVGPLLEDTNPANTLEGLTNYARFDGLTADGVTAELQLTVAGVNGPIAGFQLVEVPEPGSLALVTLGGLLIARRRRA